MEEKSLRDQAIDNMREAYRLLDKAGIPHEYWDVAYNEHEYVKGLNKGEISVFEGFSCALGCEDSLSLDITKAEQPNHQYQLEVTIQQLYNISLWWRIKEAFNVAKSIILNRHTYHSVLIGGESINRFKDVLKKLP